LWLDAHRLALIRFLACDAGQVLQARFAAVEDDLVRRNLQDAQNTTYRAGQACGFMDARAWLLSLTGCGSKPDKTEPLDEQTLAQREASLLESLSP
jgi:hypothetical protein